MKLPTELLGTGAQLNVAGLGGPPRGVGFRDSDSEPGVRGRVVTVTRTRVIDSLQVPEAVSRCVESGTRSIREYQEPT